MNNEHEKLHELMPISRSVQVAIRDMELHADNMEGAAKMHDKIVMIRDRSQLMGCTVTMKCRGNFSDFVATVSKDMQEEIIAMILKHYQVIVNNEYEEIQKIKEQL